MGAFQDVSSRPYHARALFCAKLESLFLQILPELLDGDRQNHVQQKNDLLIHYLKQTHIHKQDNHLLDLFYE